MDVDVGGAGNAGDLPLELLRDLVVSGGVAADYLHVDGRGKAEVQNLVGDVGGFKEEGHIREALMQALAELIEIEGGGAVLFGIQGNEDVAIGGADGGAVAEGKVEAAVGDADV